MTIKSDLRGMAMHASGVHDGDALDLPTPPASFPPFPIPSCVRIWHFRLAGQPIPWKRARRNRYGQHKTHPACVVYKRDLAIVAKGAGVRLAPTGTRIGIAIRITRATAHPFDVDNMCKQVLDALEGVAYENDRVVDQLYVERCTPDRERPGLEVVLWQIA